MCGKGTISIESIQKSYLFCQICYIYEGKGLELEAEPLRTQTLQSEPPGYISFYFFQDISLPQGVVLDLQCQNIRDS